MIEALQSGPRRCLGNTPAGYTKNRAKSGEAAVGELRRCVPGLKTLYLTLGRAAL